MDAGRLKLLLCGQKVIKNEVLKSFLQIKYDLICINNFQKLESVLTQQSVNLIIVEYAKNKKKQLKILKDLKLKMPDLIFLVVNGSESVQNAAEILAAGASDVFPRPYNPRLLAERVDGLLK